MQCDEQHTDLKRKWDSYLGVIHKERHAWGWGSMGKRDEALHGGGGSLGQR